jgi:Tfp pilus assembly protein PilV
VYTKCRQWLSKHLPRTNEQGLSLVEILIAVTIMSIICVAMMGYFTSAVDKSAEESRRIIAANLGRLKAAELRHYFKDNYSAVEAAVAASPTIQFTGNNSNAASPLMMGRLDRTVVNGTTYRYLIELDGLSPRMGQLTATNLLGAEEHLVSMKVTVYWSGVETFEPQPKSSTTLDTYIVKRW